MERREMTSRSPHRSRWDGSLDERRRIAVFALAAALLTVATIALSWTNRPSPSAAPVAISTGPTTPPPRSAEVDAGPPRRPRPLSRPLRRTAERFLRGYLPFLYGQAPLHAVTAAAPALRRRLARQQRRVPPAARRRRPRVRHVRLGAFVRDARAWRVMAQVADGDVVFPIELLIANRGGRLVVIQTGGE
jgi:hypothetical protein